MHICIYIYIYTHVFQPQDRRLPASHAISLTCMLWWSDNHLHIYIYIYIMYIHANIYNIFSCYFTHMFFSFFSFLLTQRVVPTYVLLSFVVFVLLKKRLVSFFFLLLLLSLWWSDNHLDNPRFDKSQNTNDLSAACVAT